MGPRRADRSGLWLRVVALWAGLAATSYAAGATKFLRGDSNADSAVDLGDAVHQLVWLFAPEGDLTCADASDANDDGVVEVSDAVSELTFLFLDGPALPLPYPSCGLDPVDDSLGCSSHAPCDGPDLSALSDRFEGGALDPSWTVRRGNLVDLSVSGGALVLQPNQFSLWFNASEGAHVAKRVDGDFKVTATVRARSAASPDQPPALNIHLGGIMARDPAGEGGPENYVFIVVGHDENDLSVETKTTVNDASTYTGPSWPSGDAELRLCRLGPVFRLYKRAIGGAAWTLAATFTRNDLPPALEVGPLVYAPSSPPDLRVSFEEVIFEDAGDPAECAAE